MEKRKTIGFTRSLSIVAMILAWTHDVKGAFINEVEKKPRANRERCGVEVLRPYIRARGMLGPIGMVWEKPGVLFKGDKIDLPESVQLTQTQKVLWGTQIKESWENLFVPFLQKKELSVQASISEIVHTMFSKMLTEATYLRRAFLDWSKSIPLSAPAFSENEYFVPFHGTEPALLQNAIKSDLFQAAQIYYNRYTRNVPQHAQDLEGLMALLKQWMDILFPEKEFSEKRIKKALRTHLQEARDWPHVLSAVTDDDSSRRQIFIPRLGKGAFDIVQLDSRICAYGQQLPESDREDFYNFYANMLLEILLYERNYRANGIGRRPTEEQKNWLSSRIKRLCHQAVSYAYDNPILFRGVFLERDNTGIFTISQKTFEQIIYERALWFLPMNLLPDPRVSQEEKKIEVQKPSLGGAFNPFALPIIQPEIECEKPNPLVTTAFFQAIPESLIEEVIVSAQKAHVISAGFALGTSGLFLGLATTWSLGFISVAKLLLKLSFIGSCGTFFATLHETSE